MEKRVLAVLTCVLLVLAAGGAHANLLSGCSYGNAITSLVGVGVGFVGMSMNDYAPAEAVSLDSSGSSDGIGVIAVVPIPGAVWLLGSGLVVLLGLRRRRRR